MWARDASGDRGATQALSSALHGYWIGPRAVGTLLAPYGPSRPLPPSEPMSTFDLSKYGIKVTNVLRNAEPAILYEQALRRGEGEIVSSGALAALSGQKTGRSPKDKRIVDAEPSTKDIWWGYVNIKLADKTFQVNRQRAIDFLNTRDQLYVADEVFVCGTAAECIGLSEIDFRKIGDGNSGRITREIQNVYHDAIRGKVEQYESWCDYVG